MKIIVTDPAAVSNVDLMPDVDMKFLGVFFDCLCRISSNCVQSLANF